MAQLTQYTMIQLIIPGKNLLMWTRLWPEGTMTRCPALPLLPTR